MSDPTYRIPTTGLFLEADGTLVPKPKAGGAVVNASEALASELTAKYVGKSLQLMSNPGSTVPSGDATKESLKHFREFGESIVLIGEFVELGFKIAEFMDAFPHTKDPAITMLERIDARLNEIQEMILAAWAASRADQIALLRSKTSTALSTVREYLELNRPQTDFWQNKIALADHDSEMAVKAFTESGLDGGFWLRPFSLRAMGINPNAINKSWLHLHPDLVQIAGTSHLTQVWDYRFALPAVVYAIIVRIAVLKAVKPQSLQTGQAGCREIRDYSRFLRAVVQRIQDGIWTLDKLADDQGSRVQFLWRGRAPVAVAQTHSGYGFMRIVFAYEWEGLQPSNPAMWPSGLVEPLLSFDKVNENIYKVARHWWHLVWRDIGMIEMCKIISDIERACTLPVFSRLIGDAQKRLLIVQNDVTTRRAASVASGIAHLTSVGDAALDAFHTFQLFESLRKDDVAVREVLKRTKEELIALAPQEEPAVRAEPVAWWKGQDDTRDSAGGNDGHESGHVRYVTGKAGKAFAFSEDGCIEVANSPALEPQTVTVAAWARRDGPPGDCTYLVSKGSRGCDAASYALYTGETGGLFFYVSDRETVVSSPDAGRTLWNNAWHFVVGTYDGQIVRIYVDGSEVGEGTPANIESIEYDLPDGDELFIGAYRGTCDRRFNDGKLDEVRVFDRALSAADVRELFDSES